MPSGYQVVLLVIGYSETMSLPVVPRSVKHGWSRAIRYTLLTTGRLSPPTSSQLVTVINTVINRPVNNSSIVHGTLMPRKGRGAEAQSGSGSGSGIRHPPLFLSLMSALCLNHVCRKSKRVCPPPPPHVLNTFKSPESPFLCRALIALATGPGRRTSRQSKRGGVYPCCEVFQRRTEDEGENATRAR